MSIHPSLTISDKDKKPRSVLKRTERLKIMLEKNQWREGDDVYGLPKIKTIRIKIKKEKAEKVADGTTAEGTAAPAAGTKEAVKAAPLAKGAGEKKADKK